jgi:thiosulfate dehydrogenase
MQTRFLFKQILVITVLAITFFSCSTNSEGTYGVADTSEHLWHGWNKYQIPIDDTLVKYGEQLIEKTSFFLGPKGAVSQITNGMNCQNCHLSAGTVPWGNNYGAVFSTYPKNRARSGKLETISKRVNDCLQRSLNGEPIDTTSKEMQAILAYMKWLGEGIEKNHSPKGSGIMDIPFLERAADPLKGKIVFANNCQRCHGAEGLGQKNMEGYGYTYPPLWGPNSYNTAAGLFRISRFAGYVKNNMPNDQANYSKPILSDEEAWDVAAFVNSQTRPSKIFKEDWPDISKKPIDHPFGPFTDGFSEEQHKYGPFKPIIAARKNLATK